MNGQHEQQASEAGSLLGAIAGRGCWFEGIEPGPSLRFLPGLAPAPGLPRLEGITSALPGPLGRQLTEVAVPPFGCLRDVVVPDTFSDWHLPTEAERIRAAAMRARYAQATWSCERLAEALSARPPHPETGGGFGIEDLTPSEY
jgi:hypothetical protein